MADTDVATKAPESDAQEPSMISSEDTPAQSGQSIGVGKSHSLTCLESLEVPDSQKEHCTTDRPSRRLSYVQLLC